MSQIFFTVYKNIIFYHYIIFYSPRCFSNVKYLYALKKLWIKIPSKNSIYLKFSHDKSGFPISLRNARGNSIFSVFINERAMIQEMISDHGRWRMKERLVREYPTREGLEHAPDRWPEFFSIREFRGSQFRPISPVFQQMVLAGRVWWMTTSDA